MLSEVEQAAEGGSASIALLGAVASLAQACTSLASTELPIAAIGKAGYEMGYKAGWRDGQQAQARPRKRRKRRAYLRLVR